MSQLRKSASFRSRIPVRRSRLPQRRCCSPPPGGVAVSGVNSNSSTTTINNIEERNGLRLQTNRSFAFEKCDITRTCSSNNHKKKIRSHSSKQLKQKQKHHKRYSSSSSFSSSDESYESEAPRQKFIKPNHKNLDDNSMYISTDGISFDGPLDSVSSESFSSPPSPVQYQNTKMPFPHSSSYESLDKYNVALETLKLSENGGVHRMPFPLPPGAGPTTSSKFYNLDSKHNNNSTAKMDAIKEDIKKSYYNEKQKQLSDWYYIKNTPKDSVVSKDDGDKVQQPKEPTIKEGDEKTVQQNGIEQKTDAMSSRYEERQDFPSSSHHPQSSTTMNWNNFDCQVTDSVGHRDDGTHSGLTNDDTIRPNHCDVWQKPLGNFQVNNLDSEFCTKDNDDDDSIHGYDNVPLRESRQHQPSFLSNYNQQQKCYESACNCKISCPDDFSKTKFNSTSNIGNETQPISVNLLKQRYQRQDRSNYATSHTSNNEYVNASFRRRPGGNVSSSNYQRTNNNNFDDISVSKYCKNNVEMQLEHWENMSNINKTTDSRTRRYDIIRGIGACHAGDKDIPISCNNTGMGGTTNSNNRKRTNMGLGYRGDNHHHQNQKQNPNPTEPSDPEQQLQQQKQLQTVLVEKQRHAIVLDGHEHASMSCQSPSSPLCHRQYHHSHHQHHFEPKEHPSTMTMITTPCSMASNNQQTSSRMRQHNSGGLGQVHSSGTNHNNIPTNSSSSNSSSGTNNVVLSPVLSARLTVVSTPRAALRSRIIQKRPDETSCSSSFEQLNVIGIPTNPTEAAAVAASVAASAAENLDDYKQVQYQYQTSTLQYQQPYNAHQQETTIGQVHLPPHSYPTHHHHLHQQQQQQQQQEQHQQQQQEQHIHHHNQELQLQLQQQEPNSKICEEDGFMITTRPTRITSHPEDNDDADADGNDKDVDDDAAVISGNNGFGILETKRRPLPEIPLEELNQQQQKNKIFPPKTSSCRSDCELSGSYASLECPSPPGPPACLPESRRDPQARLSTYLRTFYTDLSLKEPIIPPWAIPVAPGALCPARLEPELRLHSQSHGFNDTLTVDQILISLQTKEGTFLEAPRRVLIECPTWASRSSLCLRILHAWAKEPPWPAKGTPVALALFIPLSEAKRSLSSYVEKDLLPKGPLNPFASGFGGFNAAWNSLEALGPKLLIILDGYDNQKNGTPKRKNKQYSSDVHDLLDGKLFPEARVIITTSSSNAQELLPIIQRHITFEGLTWGRSASLLGGGQWGGPSRLLDTVQACANLRKAVRTPNGCLALAAIYEATGGDLPTEELDVVESILNCVAPETSASNVAELGRLALFCLKMKRSCITMAEIRMYCSCPESNIMGCLDKNLLLGKSAKKKAEYVYNPICPGMIEFLAANYIASLVNRPGLLAAEITGLSIGDELDPDLLKVIKFSMGLLGERAHILLSRLTPLWLTPQIVFSLALAGGSTEENLAALCDILGISKHPPISPLEAKPLWVQVRSVATDLMGWGMALKSPTCTLKNLELIYQLEKHNILDSRNAIEVFLNSMSINESVSTLRVSSLIETEVKDSEIAYLANCVSKLLMKPRLENFELVLTLLEEDPPILKLQSVVAALCRAIPRQPKLSFLLLDLGLSTSQLVQLCATLEKCPNVTRLSLPHLRCERGAISALSSLLNARPFSFLSLPSCWGARDDPPSSSGVSMGSGSGSSTGTSGLIKQGSLPGVPSPRSYAPGIFSSLPRGVFVPPTTLGRSATLPRQPLDQSSVDKRSCDSVVSKTWYPTPACDGGPHNSGTLHDLLLAARESYSKLHGLDLSKAQLSLEDSMCLGETVRLSNTLHTLKLEGSSRLSEILPSVLGASESPCLQMLSIGSPRLSLEDSAIAMCARALTSCSTLRLLSLDGWSFRIENLSTLSIMRAFLSLTSIRELSLANCRLQIGLIRSDTKVSRAAFECRSVVVLKLSGAQVTCADANILRGPQLLPFIGGFPCLRELDLSAPARSGLGSTHSSPLILDDKCIVGFFQNLHSHFGLLNTLKICNWVVHFDDVSRTLKTISKCIRNSPISHLKVDGISVLDRPRKHRIESHFIHCFISSLPLLRWLGISLSGKKEDQITAMGNSVLDLKGYEIDIKLSESTIEHAKLMAQAISLDGKFDIKVSTFGTSSGILIHAEKSGTKSLTRKNKD